MLTSEFWLLFPGNDYRLCNFANYWLLIFFMKAIGKVEYVRREIPSERGSVGRVGENPWKVVEEDRLKKIWCERKV